MESSTGQRNLVIGRAHSLESITVIDQDELHYVREIAFTSKAQISLHRWTTDEFSLLVVKKSFHQGSSRDEQHLRKEMAILTQLSHDNIVTIHGVVQSPSSCGLGMEYCPFGSCKQFFTTLWKKSTRTSGMDSIVAPLKIRIISEVISAMAYLHNRTPKQVLHLDLKPDNILLSDQLHAKLCDFELSRMKPSDEVEWSMSLPTDNLEENFAFISPERLKNTKAEATTKDDVFSFGITCWEILTDRNPYEEQLSDVSDISLLEQHIAFDDLRPDVSLIPDAYHKDLTEMIRKAWTTDPDTRPEFIDLDEEVRRIKHTFENFEKTVDEARLCVMTLHNMVNPECLRTRRASLSDVKTEKVSSNSPEFEVDVPCFDNITVAKRHSWNNPAIQHGDQLSEHEPLIPNISVQKPFLTTTKTLVAVSFFLSVAAAVGVLIWWEVKTKGCSDYKAPTHGFVNCMLSQKRCMFTCQEGYTLVGKDETICNDGYWNNDLPKCARVCPDVPKISHGQVYCSNEEFVNSTCKTTCLDNRIVTGNSTVRCRSDGAWSSPFPSCECEKCKVGNLCEYSISWKKVESVMDAMYINDHATVNYGGQTFTCTTGTYDVFAIHCICTDFKTGIKTDCKDESASKAAVLASSKLIRDLVAKDIYALPCDGSGMPTSC